MTSDLEITVPNALDVTGLTVRAFRQQRGESFSGLARSAGIATERLAQIEAGSTLASYEVSAIALALDIKEADLVAAVEQASPT